MSTSQRYFARLKTQQTADLTFPNGDRLSCMICDFCQKGLHLRPAGQDPASSIGSRHATGEEVQVEFTAVDQSHHRLHGRLVHNSASGFGLYIDHMPEQAFNSLFQARTKLPASGLTQGDLLSEERQAIFRDCLNLFHAFIGQAWDELINQVRMRVKERDAYPLPLGDHSRFLNGLTDLLLRADVIRRHHFDLLVERMQQVDPPAPAEPPDSIDALSIVDEGSFEDWLNVSGIANHLESELRGVMFQFSLRFSRLTPATITPRNDPFGPLAVCQTFQQALAEIAFDNAMRALLYKQFGNMLGQQYAGLYAQLNRLLAPLKPVEMPLESGHEAAPATRTVASGKPMAQGTDDISEQVSKLAEIAEKLFTLQTSVQPDHTTTSTEPASPAAATEHPIAPRPNPERGAAASDGKIHQQQLAQILEQIAPASRSPAPHAEPAKVTDEQAYPSRIENLLSQYDSTGNTQDETSVSNRITQLLSQPTVANQLSVPLREELGAMASLLNRALAEHSNQSDIDRMLKKIERPLYDLALRSDSPIQLENHPLGRLINLVDRFAIVADDNGRFHDPHFRDLVDSIIDKGLGKEDPAIEELGSACDALEKLLRHPAQARKLRVEGYQEISEAQGRIRDSNRSVADDLNARLTRHAVPAVIPKLLDLGWQHRMVLLMLRGDRAEYEQSWQILEQLLDATEPSSPGAAENDQPQLLGAIESRLSADCVASRQIDEMMMELFDFLRSPVQAEQVMIPEGWFKRTDRQSAANEAENEDLVAQLRIGDWWDIEHNARPVPMQLIWLSQPPGRACFVNRSADRKLDLTLGELADLADKDKAKPSEDRELPLLERSEYSLVDGLYRRLVQQATHDPVTNLPNRKALLNQIGQTIHFGSMNSFCVLGFKPYRMIFDHCGIQAGENLTRMLADAAKYTLGTNDRLAVIGEGVFAIYLPGLNLEAARHYTERLRKDLEGFKFRHDEESFSIQAHFGLASYLCGTFEPAEALRRATSALEVAQSIGPGTIQAYADSDNLIQNQESMESWAGQINDMLSNESLFLRCQKVLPLQDGNALPYYEVLLGVLDKRGATVNPQPFVLAVERWKRAHELDLWVFSSAIAWIRRNRAAFERIGGFSINLSAQSLANADLLATLHKELAAGDLPCNKLIFEITETATLISHAVAQDFIRQIRRYGCHFSLDDFGSGNASFNYLRSLRTDTVKIDGAFIRDMADDPELQAMVRSMNEIGHTLGMKTVAEFVSTPELLALVREFGIDYAQGYEVEKPIHIDQLAANS